MIAKDELTVVSDSRLFEYYTVGWELDWLGRLDDQGMPRDREYLRRLMPTLDLISNICQRNDRITILDAGCGVGIYDINILKRFPEAIVYSFDVSKIQLPQARMLADKFKVGSRLNLFAANVNQPPLAASFDMVICTEVLEHILEPSQTLQSLKKLSTEKTYFILSTPQIYNGIRQSGMFYKQTLPDGKVIHTQDAAKLVAGIHFYEYYHALYDVPKLSHLLKQNGFHLETVIGVDFFIPPQVIPGDSSFFRSLILRIKNGVFRAINFAGSLLPVNMDRLLNRFFDDRYASTLIVLCKAINNGN